MGGDSKEEGSLGPLCQICGGLQNSRNSSLRRGGKGGHAGVGGNTEVRVQGSISVSRLRAKVFRALTRVK